MRALSIRQPWASLIRAGTKTIELRSWNTRYRGPVVICASRTAPTGDYARVARERGLVDAPRGVVMCLVDLEEARVATPRDAHSACHPIASGIFAWSLHLLVTLDPEPAKGRLGFWPISTSLLKVNRHPLDIRPFRVAK